MFFWTKTLFTICTFKVFWSVFVSPGVEGLEIMTSTATSHQGVVEINLPNYHLGASTQIWIVCFVLLCFCFFFFKKKTTKNFDAVGRQEHYTLVIMQTTTFFPSRRIKVLLHNITAVVVLLSCGQRPLSLWLNGDY